MFVPNSTTLYPSCSCKGYTSNLLPCCHIARVFVTVSDRLYENKKTIHPYWWLTNHPLYESVYLDLCNSINLKDIKHIELINTEKKRQ